MIKVEGLYRGFGEVEVLRGVSLEVARGEVVSIVGPSGAGKTTLLQIIGTLLPADRGVVEIDGIRVNSLNDRALSEFRNRRIGFVFQFHHLLPEFTALENVCIPALIGGEDRRSFEISRSRSCLPFLRHSPPVPRHNEPALHLGSGGEWHQKLRRNSFGGKIQTTSKERARELLDMLGMSHRAMHKPAEMSGGEQQRIAIARALINEPAVLLADEPSGNLDTKNRDEIHRLFFELREKLGQTIVVVTHDEGLASMADRKITMQDGQIVSSRSEARVEGFHNLERGDSSTR